MDETPETNSPLPGDKGEPANGLLTLVCLTCGHEYFYEKRPPDQVTCDKCGSTVFREFYTPRGDDEVASDFSDSTSRDLDPDDAEGDTLPGDVLDLNP